MPSIFDDWTAETWAQVISATFVVVAAFFAWRSAKASVRAGTQAALVERLGRYAVIRQALKAWGQGGDMVRVQYRLEIHRNLRASDRLPRCHEVGDPTDMVLSQRGLSLVDDALKEIETEMDRIERRLGV